MNARKKAKNLYMYKTHGRRPWNPLFKTGCTLQWAADSARRRGWHGVCTFYGGYYIDDNHYINMDDFMSPSGFKTMSLLASAKQARKYG